MLYLFIFYSYSFTVYESIQDFFFFLHQISWDAVTKQG